MKYNELGKTGIVVSQMGFGTLPAGPLQAKLAVSDAAAIIRHALESGINFIDTAQRYGTYDHVREALVGYDKPVVIASKSWAASYEDMRDAIAEAREKMDRDVIDIFHMHAARAGANVFNERKGALQYLCQAKAEGLIRAVGISTHSVKAVRAAAEVPEIDVIHPLINLLGVGILDGTLEEMREAITYAASKGKGIYLMKALAGGHLVDRYQEALDFSFGIPGTTAIAVGMLSKAEVDANIAHIEGRQIDAATQAAIGKRNKKLYVFDQCKGCGACEQNCPNGAIKVQGAKAVVDPEICLLCGYCVPHCPQFCLRLINR